MQKLVANTSSSILFPKAPTLHFYPETNICPTCGSMLHVQKTTATKTVVTMDIGAFYAKETVLFCPHDKKKFFSDQLRSLVPRGGTFGFDVIVEVGLALFVHCRNNIEIMTALAAENVFISEREVSYLGGCKSILLVNQAANNFSVRSFQKSSHQSSALNIRRASIGSIESLCQLAPGIFNRF